MDFSGIERGGRAYAEGIMRGSEQLGAGIRSVGASIGQAIEKTGEMKANIKAAQSVMQGITGMDGINPKAIERLNMMSERLNDEEIPLSQRNAMASTLRSMGSTLFAAGVQKMMETPVEPPKLTTQRVGDYNVLIDENTGKVFQTSLVRETPDISSKSLSERTAFYLGQANTDVSNITTEQLNAIRAIDPAVAGDIQRQKQQQQIEERKLVAEEKASLDPSQEASLEALGKSNAEWITEGRARATANLQTYYEVSNALISGKAKTGQWFNRLPQIGSLPEYIGTIVDPESQANLAKVYGVVTQSLRETLGAQFTEREGQRLVNATYNPGLDEAGNLGLIKTSARLLENVMAAKDSLAEYMANNEGSAMGYNGYKPEVVFRNGLLDLERAAGIEPGKQTIRTGNNVIEIIEVK